MSDDNTISVSELNESIKNVFQINFDQPIKVIGEITNLKPSKGHLYFDLKDELSMIKVNKWNYDNLKNKPKIENGTKVIVKGKLSIFSRYGTYNINADSIEPLGVGNLHTEYLKLKDYYTQKGYFNDEHKKKLDGKIEKVGIITAKDGAALQDFLYVLKKNNYDGEVYIKNCIVQGKDCPKSVCECLKILDTMDLDVIVIARGGGSFEDLFGFSDKHVIEAIYKMKTRTISAIGHEIDFMLSDYVADIRAPTPSIAGEMISCKKEGIFSIQEIDELIIRIKYGIKIKLSTFGYELITYQNKLKSPFEIIDNINKMLIMLEDRLNNKVNTRINNLNSQLNDIGVIINNCQVIDNKTKIISWDDKMINTRMEFIESTDKKKKLKIRFKDGEVSFDIRNIKLIDE